ncbi:MAG: hypothetical protein EHM24_14720, partial [Acidobacteria bacterium]
MDARSGDRPHGRLHHDAQRAHRGAAGPSRARGRRLAGAALPAARPAEGGAGAGRPRPAGHHRRDHGHHEGRQRERRLSRPARRHRGQAPGPRSRRDRLERLGRRRAPQRDREAAPRQRPAPDLDAASLRYSVHLNAPGWNVIGAGEPALPGVAAGHNDRVAFGFT